MAFLNVLFITSSLAAVSSGGSVFCIPRPPVAVSEIYLSPDADYAPLYPFEHAIGGYICTDPVSQSDLLHGVHIRVLRAGARASEFWPAETNVFDLNGAVITRLAYIIPDTNQLFVVYAAKGVGYIVVDETIPKSVAETYVAIQGDVSFLNPDPILRIYLRAEKGRIDVRHYAIENVAEIPQTEIRLSFAACSLSVSDFSAKLTKFDGKDYITGRFRIVDGDGKPLLIQNLSVQVGSQVITPQYSSSDMYYSFFAPYSEEIDKIIISADVSGCSHLEHEEQVSFQRSNYAGVVLVLLAVVAVAAAVYYKRKNG